MEKLNIFYWRNKGEKKRFFLLEALISLNIFCTFFYCFFKLFLVTFNIDRKAIELSTYSRNYYRELESLKIDIEEAEVLKICNEKKILVKKNNNLKEYFFTKDLKLQMKENSGKRETYIENITGEFIYKDNLIFLKTRKKNERIDYVFYKK